MGNRRGPPSPPHALAVHWPLAAPILALPLLLGGCVALVGSGIAVAATSYLGNGLSRSFHADPDTIWRVSQEALRLEGYHVPTLGSREHAENRIVCISSSAYEVLPRETQVWIEPNGPGFTRVHVRVGMFQSADSIRDAERILTRIDDALRGEG